jgi:uncharacterized membrane protein
VSWFRGRDLLDRTFEIGIIIKAIDGVAEILGGLLLIVLTPAGINHLIAHVTQHELSTDPHDFVATHLLRFGASLSGAGVGFAAAYLLAHGIVKVGLVVAVLRNQLWAYPALIVVLVLFIVYQLYQLSLRTSGWLIGLTIFDAFIVWLTVREWRRQREKRGMVNAQ